MAHKFFEDKVPHNGMTYEDFIEKWEQQISNLDKNKSSEQDAKLDEYKKLNLQRTRRVESNYEVSDELKEELEKIEEPQIWMVITENWCGDSAQNLPVIAKIAKENSKINFRIILRDSHPDIMDKYLTNGSRSIPKLVVFDEEGNELFQWGPRPKVLQDLFYKLRDEGMEKNKIYEQLHAWYPKHGAEEMEKEFLELIDKSLLEVNERHKD